MKIKKIIISLSIMLLVPSLGIAGGNTTISSFSKAKRLLLTEVYADHRETFYCGCPYKADKKVVFQADKFSPAVKHRKRADKIEWEHVVPAEAFGHSFKEWRDGDPACVDKKGKPFKGRGCAEKVNMQFRYMQADLYNLVPAIGQVNALRSNYSYAMIPGEKRQFGPCDMEIEDGKAEPRPEIRGDIARIYFYMHDAYPARGIIGKKNRKLFEAWAKEDPVDDWERERSRRIEKIQGNNNKFVE